jgi:RNA polymerase sigma factor (sigma-70 family)
MSRALGISLSWNWDFAAAESVVASQRWVLSAMQKHGSPLVSTLWRILGNEQDVCDAYQDTFLQLAHFRGGQKPDHIKAFVFRTASNIAISMLRRRKVHEKAFQKIASQAQKAQQTNPSTELDSKRLQEDLRDNITRLPDRLRSVIVLKDLAELSYPQVASILSIAVPTARIYRCRAVRLLSTWMARREGI